MRAAYWFFISFCLTSVVLTFGMEASAATAATNIPASFKAAGLQIPEALRAEGYTPFGSLNLEELENVINSVVVLPDNNVGKRNNNGRLSARWEIHGNSATVYVYPAWWNKFVDQRPLLALHEYLGAAGFNDDNYWISTSMWFLSLPETQQILDASKKMEIMKWIALNANQRLPRGTAVAGGVIGVGGGGESGDLYGRMHSLRRSLQELSQPQSPEDREVTFGQIDHDLSSHLTVFWSLPK